MIYRQKIGIGLSTRPPSRLLSKCRPDQQDSMAVVGLYLFPINIDMSRLPEYHRMFRRLLVFLKNENQIRYVAKNGKISFPLNVYFVYTSNGR